ncbi:MAG TPA: trypsin-like peptidase domain-containing protein [Burkholderiales bacterium]|nr:trypsin-like peptidase domain-containing protein [Burkholderiales bacterium]
MRRLWNIFAQATTVCLAVLFVVSTLKPEWLPSRAPGAVAVLQQEAPEGAAPSAPRPDSHHAAVSKAMPSVVGISTTKEVRLPRNSPLYELRRFLGDEAQRATSLGSGVVVSAGGYILTNNHVVEAADEIEVSLSDGRTLIATVVGNDPETDLAVLRVEAKDLPAITFGSSDALRVGDVVLAIGNPFGFGQTVTMGIVSALGRSGLGINVFENFIQTDAAINPGNSGGALIDGSGNLVGVNTAIFSRSGGSMGIGFATPVSTAKSVLEQIIRSGAVTRGWIGVELAPLTPALAESFKLGSLEGAIIKGVLTDGPADRAGVKPGDVLLSIDGKPAADPQAVLNMVTVIAPGSSAKVRLKRKGEELELPLTVGRRPKPQAQPE